MNNNQNSLPCEGQRNATGTSNLEYKCGSWKQHWLNYSGIKEWPYYCSVRGCMNRAEFGLHVYNPRVSRTVYIVPGCNSCNHRIDTFSIEEGTQLAFSNKSQTCEQ